LDTIQFIGWNLQMPKKTKTSGFGVGKRESHDSSAFYNSLMYQEVNHKKEKKPISLDINLDKIDEWADRVYCHNSEDMPLPNNCIALAFTSPPYNSTKDYTDHVDNMSLTEYLDLIKRVGKEVFRVLIPGGRYLVNIAGIGRTPYLPMQAYFHHLHSEIGFQSMGEIIWQKAKGASGSCAWGSWMSAKSPRLRDIHEYILVFTKDLFSRPDKGESDITREEFMESTLSVWNIPPESAKKIGHPAPFSVALASRVIKLYSYRGDVILDPFNGSGTTCVAAKKLGRHYVGFDISPEYCQLAETRIAKEARNTKS
jgi:site-specific DNA-methyltransferase (adenine-specific)